MSEKKLQDLTDFEIRLLDAIVENYTTAAIAKAMDYSEGSIRVLLHRLYESLGVVNMTEAAVWYLRQRREKE